jgi:hypothetical protein
MGPELCGAQGGSPRADICPEFLLSLTVLRQAESDPCKGVYLKSASGTRPYQVARNPARSSNQVM